GHDPASRIIKKKIAQAQFKSNAAPDFPASGENRIPLAEFEKTQFAQARTVHYRASALVQASYRTAVLVPVVSPFLPLQTEPPSCRVNGRVSSTCQLIHLYSKKP
ncbi:hypothetical protein, partial [Streptomyces hilarionis]|uniref:hypothetical protein n=1 Tax=Streptomyces hilarionis TaxID=2839954 RepID=UPI002119E46C